MRKMGTRKMTIRRFRRALNTIQTMCALIIISIIFGFGVASGAFLVLDIPFELTHMNTYYYLTLYLGFVIFLLLLLRVKD